MSASIRILLLNDFSTIRGAIFSRLMKAGLVPEGFAVEDQAEFKEKTAEHAPHLILLSDQPKAGTALVEFEQVQLWLTEQDTDIPIWMVIDPQDEMNATDAMYQGLDDYFFSDRLNRLAPMAAHLVGLEIDTAEPVDLNHIVESYVNETKATMANGPAVFFLPGADLPKVSGEIRALSRALFSLFDQVSKTVPDSLRHDVRTYLDALRGEVCLEIKLTGKAAPEDNPESNPLIDEESLDLTATKKIVEAHNGHIDVDQGDSADMRICIFLPAILGKEVKGTPNLLVVENSVLMRSILKEALEHEGFKVRTAENGAKALEQMSRFLPDLIISDVAMPVMDGFDFFEAVRAKPRWQEIPFIFVTGQSEQKLELNSRALRGATYLIKPIVIDELLVAVRSRLPE